jgi:hypothetical protein
LPGGKECGLPLTAHQVIAISKVEQITLKNKINTRDRTEIISIIIGIKYQQTRENHFWTVKLPAHMLNQ